MDKFWKLISVYVSLAGFFITGTLLAIKGEELFFVAFKSIIAFVALYAVQSLLGVILNAAAGPAASNKDTESENKNNE